MTLNLETPYYSLGSKQDWLSTCDGKPVGSRTLKHSDQSEEPIPEHAASQPKMKPRLPRPLSLVNGPAALPTSIILTNVVPSG